MEFKLTIEEAIAILKKHHMWTGEPEELVEVRKENEALYMAIAALEQVSIEQVSIERASREKKLKMVEKRISGEYWRGYYDAMSDFRGGLI